MATIKGTNAGETKTGTTSADLIYGYGGNDKLYGRAGDDKVWGGLGDDQAWGEDGNDWLYGEDGRDSIWGGNGSDTISGGIGDDSLYGDAGTDTVKGDAGNDTIKGGTGISFLYGGDGNDTVFYDPSSSNVASIKSYLDDTRLEGGVGYDTLNIYNKTTYTFDGVTKATDTVITGNTILFRGLGLYGDTVTNEAEINVGYFTGFEKINIIGTGPGALDFGGNESYMGKGIDITGTANDDTFWTYGPADIMRGGAGNDTFVFFRDSEFASEAPLPTDTVYSETNDADDFLFLMDSFTSSATIHGFNGQGVPGGDTIQFREFVGSAENIDVVSREENGKTILTATAGNGHYENGPVTVTVMGTGLVQGVDWFMVDSFF